MQIAVIYFRVFKSRRHFGNYGPMRRTVPSRQLQVSIFLISLETLWGSNLTLLLLLVGSLELSYSHCIKYKSLVPLNVF